MMSFLELAGKILDKTLLAILIENTSECILPETQGRPTADKISVWRQVLEKCREKQKDLYFGLINLVKADYPDI